MKELGILIPGLSIYKGEGAYQSTSDRHCGRCGKRIEDADDDRGDAHVVVCFWCAFVDTQG